MSKLAPPDLFFKEICNIPEIDSRINAIKVTQEWEQSYEKSLEKYKKFANAIKMQREDKNLKLLLRYTLEIGNFMNA